MNYLHIIPTDIYTQIYKYIYDDCMKDIVFSHNDKRNTKYKHKLIRRIMNDDIWIYYTSLEIFNAVSLGIVSDANDANETDLIDEELYYLSKITEYNLKMYHYDILITELPEKFKDASCIRMKLSNIDVLLGLNIEDTEDNIYTPLYYLFKECLTTWLELIYYTNKLLKEYLLLNDLELDFFTLYRFDTVIENGYTVIVPYFEEHIV